MAQFVNMFDVDLKKRTSPMPLSQMVCEGNASANRIGAYVYDDGEAVTLGGTCTGLVMRADGTTVPLTGTISENSAYVVLDQSSCSIDGPIQVAVNWVSGSDVTTLLVAYGTVVNTTTGSYVQPSTPIPDIDQLLAEIEAMRTATAAANAAAEGALGNFAGAFSDATAYTAGQYVTYTDGKLYRFNVDHAAGAWAAADVTAVTAGGEIGELKSAIKAVATDGKICPAFQIGYLHGLPNNTPSNPGQNVNNNTVCATDYFSVTEAGKIYFDDTAYKLVICYYDSAKEYQTFVGWTTTSPYTLNTQYVYFVPEIRKIDETSFSDASVVDGTVYYTIETDIVRHEELNDVVSDLEDEIAGVASVKNISPDILPTLPINVYRTFDGYTCGLPFNQSDISGFTKIYVDSVNGVDTNSGDATHPVKTLSKAEYWMEKAAQQGKSAEIIIADGSVFYYDDLPANWDATYSIIIRAEGSARVFCGQKGTWTASSNHYVSAAFTGLNIVGCVDTSDVDDYGLYSAMIPLASEADVDTTPNSYYVDNTNKIAYVHPKTGATTDDIVVMNSNKFACDVLARKFASDGYIYVKGINFIGNSTARASIAQQASDAIKRMIYFDSCIFQHGCSSNAISANHFYYTYFVNCVGGYAKNDVFNYHFGYMADPTNALVVEVNCIGKEGGYYYGMSGTSDQISTCHDGANVLRCNTHGYNSDGSLIADVNGCYSVNLDCTVLNTGYDDAPGKVYAPYRFDNSSATRNGKTVMQNCYGYDSRNSKFVSAVDLIFNGLNYGGTIEATSLKVGKEMI